VQSVVLSIKDLYLARLVGPMAISPTGLAGGRIDGAWTVAAVRGSVGEAHIPPRALMKRAALYHIITPTTTL